MKGKIIEEVDDLILDQMLIVKLEEAEDQSN